MYYKSFLSPPVGTINNNHCFDKELEDEVEKQDDKIDLPNNAATISKSKLVFDKIVALGQKSWIHPWSASPMDIMAMSWQPTKT